MNSEKPKALAIYFSKLSSFCYDNKPGIETLLQSIQNDIGSFAKENSPKERELFKDLHERVSTWSQVWGRLGKEADFRNAVGRQAHAWFVKLSKLPKETEHP